MKKYRISSKKKNQNLTFIIDIVEIFGQEKSNSISADEAYFFFDSFFKGLFKIILKKGQLANESGNRRLGHEDLTSIISQIFGKEKFLLKDDFFEYKQ